MILLVAVLTAAIAVHGGTAIARTNPLMAMVAALRRVWGGRVVLPG